VRLVDHEQPDVDAPDRVEEARRREPLGGDVEQLHLAGRRARDRDAVVRNVLLGVDERRPPGHGALERLHLVLHQRDQRRDHEREVGPQQRRQLIAERLARPGRHHDEQVAAGERRADRLRLAGAEGAEAEVLAQRGEGWVHGGRPTIPTRPAAKTSSARRVAKTAHVQG
jgi:hypothetical protein